MQVSQSSRLPGAEDFTVVAATAGEARVIREMMDYALTVMPPETYHQGQKLIFNPRDLPTAADIDKALETARPPVRDWEREGNEERVAIIASRGAEEAATAFVQNLSTNVQVVPGRNRQLWNRLIERDGRKHFRVKVDFTKGEKSDNTFRDNEKVVKAADRVVVFWNYDDRDAALTAAAFAARRGKLQEIYDDRGEQLMLHDVSAHAMELNPSFIEYMRNKNAAAFEVDASSPEGIVGLSLIKGVNQAAATAMAQTHFSLNELIDMAGNPEEAKALHKTYGIPGSALVALTDSKAVAAARDGLADIRSQCDRTGTTIISPAHYPENLLKAPKLPPVLYVQAKDPEKFAHFGNSAAFVGDEKMLPMMAQKSAELGLAVDKAGSSIVAMEQFGLPGMVPSRPSVLVLSTGHGHLSASAPINWKASRTPGEIQSRGQHGDYVLRDTADKTGMELLYRPKNKGAEKTLKTLSFSVFAKAADAKEARQWTMGHLQSVAHNTEHASLIEPARKLRQDIVDAGGFVVSLMPPDKKGSYYSAAQGKNVGIVTTRTDQAVAKAADLAFRIGDAPVITQISADSPVRAAVAAALDRKIPVVTLTPPREVVSSEAVAGNLALTRNTADTMPHDFGVGVRWTSEYAKKFAGKRIAVHTGDNMQQAAAKIKKFLDAGRGEVIAAEPEKRRVNEPELG